jgi:hypothetical protein
MQWDKLVAQDASWNRLLYELSPALLKFALNARVNVLPTPDNLHRWGYGVHACKLCGRPRVTSAHVLTGCSVALATHGVTTRSSQYCTTPCVTRLPRSGRPRFPRLPLLCDSVDPATLFRLLASASRLAFSTWLPTGEWLAICRACTTRSRWMSRARSSGPISSCGRRPRSASSCWSVRSPPRGAWPFPRKSSRVATRRWLRFAARRRTAPQCSRPR